MPSQDDRLERWIHPSGGMRHHPIAATVLVSTTLKPARNCLTDWSHVIERKPACAWSSSQPSEPPPLGPMSESGPPNCRPRPLGEEEFKGDHDLAGFWGMEAETLHSHSAQCRVGKIPCQLGSTFSEQSKGTYLGGRRGGRD